MTGTPPEVPEQSLDRRSEGVTPRPRLSPGPSRTPRRAAPLRDVASDDRARWFKALAWGAFPGTFIGIVIFATVGPVAGIVIFLLFTFGAGGFAIAVSESAGALVRGVTNPRGRPTPGAHSRVDALVARGEPEEALTTLRVSLESYPDDAGAHIRIARILRDELHEPRQALGAFRGGRAAGCFTPAQMRVSMREMVELARKIGEPAIVSPDLEAHRELFAGEAEAAWAARELEEVSRPGDASAS